ncbi:b095dfc3-dc23-4455-9440-4997bb414aa9 [Sclerotinia trifoliorum]|uniref:B095dfc3-dc23-4455-9440-4997bb414aa9 n=1 Tax=Sclerotinia trifoliorum TaxID=28548 RepID=A0A8H2VQ88_9HELO|nr:b095dfc3-dc23-4455-9440-4997bb414aa9 [Sclerotinia trifoliorum]
MFRFLRPRAASVWAASVRTRPAPPIFPTTPLSMRLNAQRYAGTVSNTQNVRFRKAPIKARNIAINVIIVVVCFEAYTRLVLDPFDKAAEEASKDIPDDEFQEAEQPLFIPFPGTTKELPIIPYKGTDPEYQEFVKLSKDPKLLNKIRVDLAEFLRDSVPNTPVIVQLAGKHFKTRRFWLDIDFPQLPPPSFERSGIEISDDAISWVTQPVDATIVYKIRNVLWPTALFQSSWMFLKVLAAEEFRSMARVFGVEFETSPAEQTLNQMLARSQKMIKELNGQQKVPGDIQRPFTAKDGPPQQPLGDKSKEVAAASGKSNVREDILPAFVNSFKDIHTSFVAKPIMAAKIKYVQISKTLRPTTNIHPRGSITVSGLVELESDQAFLVFDVIAAWDPKKKDYDVKSMQIKLRRMQRKRQRPVTGLPRGSMA